METLNEKRKENWERKFQILCRFIEEYGRLPHAKETYEGQNIGNWYAIQKFEMKAIEYPEEQKEKLNAVAKIELEYKNDKWEKSYQLLQKFIKEFGRLPIYRETYDGKNIGAWYQYQLRKLYSPDYLKEHKRKIEDLSTCPRIGDLEWEKRYQLLEQFVREFHRLPSEKEVYEKNQIGRWYHYHRQKCKYSYYPEERRKKLEEFDTVTTIADIKWDKQYKILVAFIEEFHRLPQINETYGEIKIGQWYKQQKQKSINIKYPKTCKEKIEKLNSYPTAADIRWENHFCVLQKFIEQYGRFPKVKDTYEDEQIGRWFNRQN